MTLQTGIVAPLAGAWIEIGYEEQRPDRKRIVAPLAGAWIEIKPYVAKYGTSEGSLPLRERGLKSRKSKGRRRAGYCRSPCGSVD